MSHGLYVEIFVADPDTCQVASKSRGERQFPLSLDAPIQRRQERSLRSLPFLQSHPKLSLTAIYPSSAIISILYSPVGPKRCSVSHPGVPSPVFARASSVTAVQSEILLPSMGLCMLPSSPRITNHSRQFWRNSPADTTKWICAGHSGPRIRANLNG